MCCRRAPELAAGTPMQIMHRLTNTVYNTLVCELAGMGLVEVDIAKVTRDFQHGRRHIWLGFHIKFSFWQILPWFFFGIAHFRIDIAKAICRKCLEMRDASPALPHEHWLIAELLVNPLARKQMVEFGYNLASCMSEFPILEWFCGCFRFSLTSERWVEALHAVSARLGASSHHIGPVHLGFHTALPAVREGLAGDAQCLTELANHASKVSNPLECLRTCGLMGHPETQKLLQPGFGSIQHLNQSNRSKMIQILFHTDSATLHADLPSCVGGSHGPAGAGGGGPPPPPGGAGAADGGPSPHPGGPRPGDGPPPPPHGGSDGGPAGGASGGQHPPRQLPGESIAPGEATAGESGLKREIGSALGPNKRRRFGPDAAVASEAEASSSARCATPSGSAGHLEGQ